jgi:predicted metal-dependent hydrolase
MKQVVIAEDIQVTIKKHRKAKQLKLSIGLDGRVKLTLPYYLPYFAGKIFIKEKESWIIENFKKSKERLSTKLSAAAEKELRKKAKPLIINLVNHYSTLYNTKYHKIFIKNQQSLWGSCSRNKNLNYNWRISLAPETVMRYVIVHEICHLIEMNHSPRFWKLVALTIPEYKMHRQWLKTHGHTLY